MNKLTQIIENNPGWTMVLFGLVGLLFPGGKNIPPEAIIILLAGMIFLACFRINVPLRTVLSFRILVYYLLRYLLMPIALWAIFIEIAPAFAPGVMLLALLPAGAASPALTGIYNGNVALAFMVTIISSIASVPVIPFAMGTFNHLAIAVPVFPMLRTLVLCIILPGVFYLLLRGRPLLNRYVQTHGRITTILLVGMVIFIVLTIKRDWFIGHPQEIVAPIFITIAFYSVAALLGLMISKRRTDRVAYGITSTFNNIALGVGLAVLYFDEKTIAITIIGEAVWSFMPVIVQLLVKRFPERTQL